jgi:hypothetical protein
VPDTIAQPSFSISFISYHLCFHACFFSILPISSAPVPFYLLKHNLNPMIRLVTSSFINISWTQTKHMAVSKLTLMPSFILFTRSSLFDPFKSSSPNLVRSLLSLRSWSMTVMPLLPRALARFPVMVDY